VIIAFVHSLILLAIQGGPTKVKPTYNFAGNI